MPVTGRSTIVVSSRLAARERRLVAARNKLHGLQVMTFEQAAVRLAGGFTRSIDDESLRAAIMAALPTTPMGELDSIKTLPGMVDAAADTLQKAWRAGIDLAVRASGHPRLDAVARLETAVLSQLPASMARPVDIVAAATSRIDHAPAVLGPMEIVGLSELSPCWRPLLQALANHIPVQWTAGPGSVPGWLGGTAIAVTHAPSHLPAVRAVSAATAYHEAIEAMRWARGLLASGVAPSEIAIATASPADYDDHFLALREDAQIDLHFVHGIRTISTRDGQVAGALADIVVRGLSHSRLRRLAALCRDCGFFDRLPDGWLRILPTDAPLSTPAAWRRLLARLNPQDWPDEIDHTPALRAAVEMLLQGPDGANEIGDAFLRGRALKIWRKALLASPQSSIDATLETLKEDDGLEACVCVAWMPASALATAPRRFVRLLGLNSSRWPRGIAEDRLIPDHIIPTPVLDPLPVNIADRRDFETILATTNDTVVLSRARRDSEGRLLGRSPLLTGHGDETYLRRNATPEHAFSETDRLVARPQEFAADRQATSAIGCWGDWRRAEITAHDGLVRPDHPLILAILGRTQSASSLRRLLRNPLSFVWVYGFGWREPQSSADPLVLDALGIGDLVHMVLDRALRDLEAAGGLASAATEAVEAAVGRAAQAVATDWESERPVPPAVIWGRTLDDARVLAARALTYGDDALPGARAYGEVPFGGSKPKTDADAPWDVSLPVTVPDTGFNIAGYIDRLDISGDGKRALVRDYKTGRPPRSEIRLNGGRELQRCLYAFAVKALLGEDVAISASLLYPREPIDIQLDDPEAVLSASGQPGFTALDPFHDDRGGVCVAALDITVADEDGKASAEQQRDAEADAIAELCARLIESHPIVDRRSGAERPCLPGDIALLAPTGSELWRYEEALERRGIPVATQAGKGLFRRQEIQDLIALTRVLADRRDTLAFGALLRGPLVGLTEEELLDIIWSLPRSEEEPDRIPRLDLSVDAATIAHPLAREVIGRLQSLSRRVNSTTPQVLLSQAVDVMRVRPLLMERHRGQAERALANVDLYLSLSTGYAVRGLRAFAEAMTTAWSDEARAVEGRPDAQEEAVALFTMHAAKGLEWPIVIPVNTMTSVIAPESAVIDRQTETFYCPVLGVQPEGYEAAREAEKNELERERVRLWYVAATRARELLVLPRLDATPSKSAWISLVDLSLADLPSLDVSHLPTDLAAASAGAGNTQTRATFAAEAEAIAAAQTRLKWLAPSRDESAAGIVLREEESALWTGLADDQPPELEASALVQGGRERGLILHKLMEEVLTGETPEAEDSLLERAGHLIRVLGQSPVADPAMGLSAKELATCVTRTLALPEIATLRSDLLAELPVYTAEATDGVETVTAGIADALTVGEDGRPSIVVDWKSDVNPDAQTVEHYKAQVKAYLNMTGAKRGLIVLMTTGAVIAVSPSPQTVSA